MVWYYFLNPRVNELNYDFDDVTNLILSSKAVRRGLRHMKFSGGLGIRKYSFAHFA